MKPDTLCLIILLSTMLGIIILVFLVKFFSECLIPIWRSEAETRRRRADEEIMRRKERDTTGEFRAANNLDVSISWTYSYLRGGSLKHVCLKNADRNLRKAFKKLSALMRDINRRLVPYGATVRICNDGKLLRSTMANCISELHLDASRPRLDLLVAQAGGRRLPSDIHIFATVESHNRDIPRYVRKHGHAIILELVREATDRIEMELESIGPTGLTHLFRSAQGGADGWFSTWKEDHFSNTFNNKYEGRLTL